MERMEMDLLMIRIHGLMATGRYAEARRLLEQVLEAEPALGVAHGMMGWIMWVLVEDHGRALEHFRCAVRWAPHVHNAWMNYLNLLAGDGLEDELHAVFHRALAVSGIDRAEVRAIVARYLERTGRHAEALAMFRLARREATNAAAENDHGAQVRRLLTRLRRMRWNALFN
jgi:Tfp pilus assembly protein PilF